MRVLLKYTGVGQRIASLKWLGQKSEVSGAELLEEDLMACKRQSEDPLTRKKDMKEWKGVNLA